MKLNQVLSTPEGKDAWFLTSKGRADTHERARPDTLCNPIFLLQISSDEFRIGVYEFFFCFLWSGGLFNPLSFGHPEESSQKRKCPTTSCFLSAFILLTWTHTLLIKRCLDPRDIQNDLKSASCCVVLMIGLNYVGFGFISSWLVSYASYNVQNPP